MSADFMQYILGGLLVVIWWAITRKLDKIDGKFEKLEERQSKAEKDCVPWEEFNKLKADVTSHGTEIAVIKTTCEGKHK